MADGQKKRTNMNITEFKDKVRALVETRAAEAGFARNNPQLSLLHERLLGEAATILQKKLTPQVACRIGVQLLDEARRELRQRQKEAAKTRPVTVQAVPDTAVTTEE